MPFLDLNSKKTLEKKEMAETSTAEAILQHVADELKELVNQTLADDASANGTNKTESWKASPEGLFLAYSSLALMAFIPIIVGSFKSVKHQSTQKSSGEEIETMSTKEAMLFPVVASCTLFGIYIVFKIFSKEHINLLLAFYFFLLGVIALTRMSGYVFKISFYSGKFFKRKRKILELIFRKLKSLTHSFAKSIERKTQNPLKKIFKSVKKFFLEDLTHES